MKQCSIARANDPVPLSDGIEGTPWAAASAIGINEFPWNTTDSEQSTVVRPLYDEETLYLQYLVEDKHSYAQTTDLNGSVWKDSCVEMFAIIEPQHRPYYMNLEINCVGTLRLGFGPDRHDRELITVDQAEAIRVETSIEGPTKEESPDDKGWWVAVALPFETLSVFTGISISPSEGTIWRGNFHRLGGKTNSQFAVWNSIDTTEPDFHQPSEFGCFVFE